MAIANIFDGFAKKRASEELVEYLYADQNGRVERIISQGETTDWQEQAENEFVILIQGEAELSFADGRRVELKAGDSLMLPAMTKHRVSKTSQQTPCLWIASFWKEQKA